MNNENEFILLMHLCGHLTIMLHGSLHLALVAARTGEAPCTLRFSLSSLSPHFYSQ